MGWVHNLKSPDPNSQISRVISICLVFSITSLLAVGLRFHVRFHTKRPAWVDDYAALWSAVLGVGYAGVAIAQTRWGLGLDAAYFPIENNIPFSQIQYAGGPIYTLALLGFKVSLLASYLRIGGFVRAYRMVIVGVIVGCVCNQVIFTFVLSFACHPVAKQWDPTIPGSCINTVASYYGLAGTSLGFDILIIALPLPVLWQLQLRTRQKIALLGVFALGFFVTIIQIIRIFTIRNLKTYTDSQPIVIWSIVEISLGVIITCIPTYGPYFRSFASNISSYRRRQTSDTYRLTSNHQTTFRSKKGNQSHSQSQIRLEDGEEFGRPFDSHAPHRATVTTKVGRDGDSEEFILSERGGSGGSGGNGGIQKVTEVVVEREGV